MEKTNKIIAIILIIAGIFSIGASIFIFTEKEDLLPTVSYLIFGIILIIISYKLYKAKKE